MGHVCAADAISEIGSDGAYSVHGGRWVGALVDLFSCEEMKRVVLEKEYCVFDLKCFGNGGEGNRML